MLTRYLGCLVVIAALAQPARSQGINSETCGVRRGKDLVVFVGTKLDLKPFEQSLAPGWVSMDEAFRARYRVIKLICGKLTQPEIAFEVYDHYGSPAFADFETVLLFVSRHGNRFVHEKYQYFDVYETTDSSWAGCGDPYRLDADVHRGSIRPRPISFKRPVTFPLAGLSQDEIRRRYPAPYFERQGDSVVCRTGVTLEELFAVKRNGVLKARGLFR